MKIECQEDDPDEMMTMRQIRVQDINERLMKQGLGVDRNETFGINTVRSGFLYGERSKSVMSYGTIGDASMLMTLGPRDMNLNQSSRNHFF